jgi:ribose transport system permease protein
MRRRQWLLLAATGQLIVLLRGGIDLDRSMISFGTVLAATRFGTTL